MSKPGADRITLDRTNLRRLANALMEGGKEAVSEVTTEYERGFVDGHKSAALALQRVADVMPDLYGDEGCPIPTEPRDVS